jgi:hypothetical protein
MSGMSAATFRSHRPLGTHRLLEHCEVLARVTGREYATARARLETALGTELASRLVGALAGGHRSRPYVL